MKKTTIIILIICILCYLLSKCRPGYVTFMGKVYYNHISEGVGYERIHMDADAKTFRVDKDRPEYGMDNNKAFYFGKTIFGSDGMTFEFLHCGYQKDKNHVYYANRIIPVADPKSFKSYPPDSLGWAIRFAEDKNDFYYCNLPLKVHNKNSFRQWCVNGVLWGIDSNYCYCEYKKCEINDYEGFEVLSSGFYAKNKEHVFYLGSIVEGADPETFKETLIFRGEDKNGKYDMGELITSEIFSISHCN